MKIKNLIVALALALGVGALLAPVSVGAVNVFDECDNVANKDSAVCANKDDAAPDFVTTAIQVMMYVVGLIGVVMIIVSGIVYTTSNGEAANITKAKNILLYAITGLVVAFSAYAIVSFVVEQFK